MKHRVDSFLTLPGVSLEDQLGVEAIMAIHDLEEMLQE